MSVSRASFLKMATPSGSRRLSVIPRLLRCRFWKSKPWRLPPMPSPVRPPGISILIARAPQSTSWRTHVGPARARVRSRTERRARGRAALLAMVAAHGSARLGAGQTADRRRRARKLGSFFHILWPRHGPPTLCPITTRHHNVSITPSNSWLVGGGEMGALIRSLDWSRSPLGPIDTWPQSLRTSLGICLSSRFPMAIWWGPEIVQFYNDGYRPFLGTKHPRSMGQRGDECWAEIWNVCGPLYRHVMTTGDSTWSADLQLLMERDGYLEETYFTFAYSPIRGESADVLGNLITVTETTERVLGERRLRTLRDLGALAMAAKTPEEAAQLAAETLSANDADMPFSLLYLVEDDGRHARLVASSGGIESPATLSLIGDDARWPAGQVVASARAVVVDDLRALERLPSGPWTDPPHTALALPLMSREAARARAVYEPVDIAALTADLGGAFRSAVERAGLDFVVECASIAEPVWLDRQMWEKIVLNLLSNALKFTFEGRIVVRLRDAGERVVLEVADTGIGIGAEDLPHLFERFYRAREACSRSHEGTGIGLSLVQELVKLHGGTIDVTSRPGEGTTFSVALPRGTAHLPKDRIGARSGGSTATGASAFVDEAHHWLPEEVVSHAGAAAPATSSGRILVADDNADMREYVTRLLAQHWSVEAVADGQAALERAREDPPDLLLTDVMMPRLDGFALLEALRADPRTAAIPIILLSARAGEEARAEGLEACADDYLVKPFAARELIARVNAHLTLARIRRETERALADLFENGVPSLHWLGHDGTILRANRAELEMLGYAREEYVGRNIAEFHADPYVVADLLGRLHDGQSIRNAAARLRCRDGSIKHVLISGNVRLDGDRFAYARCFIVDATDLRHAEEERDRLLADERAARAEAETLNHLGRRLASELELETLAEVVTDAATKVVGADFGAFFYRALDERGAPVMRYALAGVPREAFADLLRLGNVALFDVTLRDGRAVRLDDVPAANRSDEGNPWGTPPTTDIPLRSYLAIPVIRSSEVLGGLVLGHAAPGRFTERHERLLGGRAAQAAIAIDNARQYKVADEARRTAESANQAKDEFLAMLAHELRNPLGVVLNGVKILDRIGVQHGEAVRTRAVMARQTQHLARLLDDLLDVARISQGKIDLRKELLDLRTVGDSALESERHRLMEKSQHLMVTMPDTPVTVYGDPARLQQVVANLVHNAAKYTPERGRVDVTVEERDDEAIVRVRDTGAGIPYEKLQTVFDLFVQLNVSKDRSEAGLGIGLTLVQRLVAQHGGRVQARSEGVGRGSEFVVTLPRVPVVAAPSATLLPPSPALRRLRILLIEDNADARDMLKMGLELTGHRVEVAADGAQGIERAVTDRPDVAIVDLGLPGIDGFTVARELRTRLGPDLRIVALTGYGQSEDRRRTQEAGFDVHITKTATVDDVLAALAA